MFVKATPQSAKTIILSARRMECFLNTSQATGVAWAKKKHLQHIALSFVQLVLLTGCKVDFTILENSSSL